MISVLFCFMDSFTQIALGIAIAEVCAKNLKTKQFYTVL
jgi:hypothetical protein